MNWQKIIDAIMATGMKQRAIAKICGCEESVIHRLRTGKQSTIFYDTGAAIIDLAKAHGIKPSSGQNVHWPA